MADNKIIKDGLGNTFTIRMRDISPLSDGSVERSMIYSTLYPVDYAGGGGCFQYVAKSGVMAAGIPAASPIWSFWWQPPGMIALISRLTLMPWTITALSGGLAIFDVYVARNFTAPDAGGVLANLVGPNNQLRTSMSASSASIQCANTGALTPGQRTLDLAPIETRSVPPPQLAYTLFPEDPMVLLDKRPGEHPLYLAANEGFVINASMPASGTWQFSVTLEWAELLPQNF
jgi:hypothetical protein